MKKNVCLPCIVLAVMLLVSCVTVPEKTSSEDCLVIIPTEMIKDNGAEQARSYFLKISDREKEIKVPSGRYGTIKFVSSDRGAMIETVASRVTNPDYKGDPSFHEVNQKISYEPGKLIINDFKIVQSIKQTKANSFMSRYDFVPLSEDEKKTFLENYLSNEDYASWF